MTNNGRIKAVHGGYGCVMHKKNVKSSQPMSLSKDLFWQGIAQAPKRGFMKCPSQNFGKQAVLRRVTLKFLL